MRQGGSVGGGKGREGRCRGPQGYRLRTRQGPGGQAKEMGCHPGGNGRAREGLHQGAAVRDLGFAKMLHPVAVHVDFAHCLFPPQEQINGVLFYDPDGALGSRSGPAA